MKNSNKLSRITPEEIDRLRRMATGTIPLPGQLRSFADDNIRVLRALLDALDDGDVIPDDDLLGFLEDWNAIDDEFSKPSIIH